MQARPEARLQVIRFLRARGRRPGGLRRLRRCGSPGRRGATWRAPWTTVATRRPRPVRTCSPAARTASCSGRRAGSRAPGRSRGPQGRAPSAGLRRSRGRPARPPCRGARERRAFAAPGLRPPQRAQPRRRRPERRRLLGLPPARPPPASDVRLRPTPARPLRPGRARALRRLRPPWACRRSRSPWSCLWRSHAAGSSCACAAPARPPPRPGPSGCRTRFRRCGPTCPITCTRRARGSSSSSRSPYASTRAAGRGGR